MRVTLNSIIVEDQKTALAFYRDTLGFVVKQHMPMGEGDLAWITLAAPDQPDGARISLEPNGFPFVAEYQRQLKANGIPLTAFAVDDIAEEYERLTAAGVTFKAPPSTGDAAMPAMATFDDTCGNWIMIYEESTC
jgi:catechol 2,3-dioxygenase-like lactoylglutathione lyase family enzyme